MTHENKNAKDTNFFLFCNLLFFFFIFYHINGFCVQNLQHALRDGYTFIHLISIVFFSFALHFQPIYSIFIKIVTKIAYVKFLTDTKK